jgi:hypothetical protein
MHLCPFIIDYLDMHVNARSSIIDFSKYIYLTITYTSPISFQGSIDDE